MAAAEYYNPGGTPQGHPQPPAPPQQQQRPPPPPQQQQFPPPPPPQSQPSNPPYPTWDGPLGPPPPYSAGSQRHSSQPPLPQQNNNGSYNPRQSQDTHQYPPEKTPQRPSTLQNMYRPSDYTSSHPPPAPPPQQPQQQNSYLQPGVPAMSQVYGNQGIGSQRRSSSTPDYPAPYQYNNRDRSRSRSRSRERRRHHNHRPELQRKKSSGVNTFLGAGGGAIIGDLIFPGLGTLGGAIIGGIGGHKYGRAQSNPMSTKSRSMSGGADYYDDDYRRGRRR